MNLEDIKKMSEEEFIEFVKNLRSNKYYKMSIFGQKKEISKEKALKNKKRYDLIYSILISISSYAIGEISLFSLANATSVLSEKNEKLIVNGIALIILVASYFASRKITSNDSKEAEIALNKNIIELKRILETLSEEELKLLIENISFYKEYQVSDELIKKSNVLSTANKLIELDATKILEEFELSNKETMPNSYSDDSKEIRITKTMKNS